jgi:hypothetical protein
MKKDVYLNLIMFDLKSRIGSSILPEAVVIVALVRKKTQLKPN